MYQNFNNSGCLCVLSNKGCRIGTRKNIYNAHFKLTPYAIISVTFLITMTKILDTNSLQRRNLFIVKCIVAEEVWRVVSSSVLVSISSADFTVSWNKEVLSLVRRWPTIACQVQPTVNHFLQPSPTSQRFCNLPKQGDHLRTKCTNTRACCGHYTLKPQQLIGHRKQIHSS